MERAIRRARAGEEEAVLGCVLAAYARYVERIGREPAPMLADYAALIARGAVYLLPGETGPRGVIVMMPDTDGLFLENIAVHPDFQGRGLGRRLMAFFEASARRQHLAAVHLYTNEAMTENLGFYTGLGFREVARRTEDSYRRVFFRKELEEVG